MLRPPKLREVKAMTISLGFNCRDGIVLCADRQLSKGEVKFYEHKIASIDAGDWSLSFAYADSRELMGFVWDRMKKHNPPKDANFDLFKYLLEETTKEAHHAFPAATLELFCAVSIDNKRSTGIELLKATNEGVREVDGWDCLGIGDSSLIRYLAETLGPVDTVNRALAVGTYMVTEAKKHIQYCGGETDATVIRVRESPEHKSNEEILEIEKGFKKSTEEINKTFWAARNIND